MDRKTILGETLKRYRKTLNYSIEYVSERLNDMGISINPRTIYAWENSTNQPTVDALMCLAHIYKLNSVLDAFGYPVEASDKNVYMETISKEELRLLKAFRAHPELKDTVTKIYGIDDIDVI